ncbi:MAG: hypothetical protein AAGA48_24255 [Myxococcota bacterium]
MNRSVLMLLWVLWGCAPREVVDNANPCFTMPESLPGLVEVEVWATGGARSPENGSCFLDRDLDGQWVLTTSFFYDRDRSLFGTELAILTFGSATCSAEVDGDSPWSVTYRDDVEAVPVDGNQHCFVTTYEAGFEPAPKDYKPRW